MTTLSLAAGTVLDAAAEEAIEAAAAAGFDAVGLRLARDPGEKRLAALRDRVAAAGLHVLDVEVVRLTPGYGAAEHAWLVDAAGRLGARFLLTVSENADRDHTARELAALCDRAAPLGVTVALEPMIFTTVPTVADAHAVVEACGRANAAVLVDALHLARAGTDARELAGPLGARVGYAQICDAPATAPRTLDEVAEEARHHRLLPGDGELPLAELLWAVGDVPLSVEVQSDVLAATMTPHERARSAKDALHAVLARARST